MKFCQFDKISTRICIFDDAGILYTGQDFNINYRLDFMNSLGRNSCYPLKLYKT